MELTNFHHQAVALVGTVALPSPYPAYGVVSFVLSDWDGDAVIYVRIVQVVSQRRAITRFVRPEDIRAIRIKPDGDDDADPESWPILGPAKTRREIADRQADIIAHAQEAGVKHLEESWHVAAILHVHEAAPVLHRHEAGVTAAASAEFVEFFSHAGIPCCG